jgi:hypothetical protein
MFPAATNSTQSFTPGKKFCTLLSVEKQTRKHTHLRTVLGLRPHSAGVKPNVRTFTALVTAMANDCQWRRALLTVRRMKGNRASASTVEPNAYTYSALLKAMGERVPPPPPLFQPHDSLLPTPTLDNPTPDVSNGVCDLGM